MIGLSPPSASHPKIFQHQLVRPSAPRYRGFGLLTDRSPGFGSAPRHSTRCSHSLSLRLRRRLNLAARGNSQAHYAKGMRSPKRAPTVRGRMISGSFHSLQKGSFHLSLTVLVRYRSADSIQPCGMGSTDSDGVSRVPPYLGCGHGTRNFAHGALTLCGRPFQAVALESRSDCAVPQPRQASLPVWAPPRSLATTCGISVDFFSSGY